MKLFMWAALRRSLTGLFLDHFHSCRDLFYVCMWQFFCLYYSCFLFHQKYADDSGRVLTVLCSSSVFLASNLLLCYRRRAQKTKKYSQTDMASSFPADATSLLGSAPKRQRATHTGGDKRLAPHYTTEEWNATNRLQKKGQKTVICEI